jgi:uncharacterized RDD family membrane protein YckC
MSQSPPTGPGAGSGWAPPPPMTVQAGPAGFVYADVPNRAIAYIIDAIVLGIVGVVIFAILTAAGLTIISGIGTGLTTNYGVSLIYALVGLVVSFGYFWYTWTRMRGTIGMRALGMQIGNAVDGKTLTNEQAVRRWIALGAPFSLAQALNPIGGVGALLGLLAFLWFLYLLYTTAKSPTKQGFHDVFANTMVVKAARMA